MLSSVDVIALIIAVIGIATAAVARKTWLLVEGDLAESWRWLLPSVPVYAVSFVVLIVHNFLERYSVDKPVLSTTFNFDMLAQRLVFNMQVWKPIVLVLKNIQVLGELAFLILVLIGLVRQYRLFEELYNKQN
ncbi:MAG TPA: hypothetical protein VGK02_09335 [Candidatus Aquicultor sp.]|jgi:hypothetical protein